MLNNEDREELKTFFLTQMHETEHLREILTANQLEKLSTFAEDVLQEVDSDLFNVPEEALDELIIDKMILEHNKKVIDKAIARNNSLLLIHYTDMDLFEVEMFVGLN